MPFSNKLLRQAERKRDRAAKLVAEAEALTQRAYDEALQSGEYMGNGYLAEPADVRHLWPKSALTY